MAKKSTPPPRPARPGAGHSATRQAPAPSKVSRPSKAASDGASGTDGASGRWLTWLAAALLITAAVYWPSLKNDFVNWDDYPNILENVNLQVVNAQSVRQIFDLQAGNVIGNYNPLPILTFAIEKKLAGGKFSPQLIHTTNLLLHLGTVFFVFRLLLLLGLGSAGAFVGALLFGIHPMRVESVAWATERKDVLFAIFFFAALVSYVKWIKADDAGRRTRLYLGMVLLAALSMLSKVQAVALPLSMLALDYYFRRPLGVKLITEKTPFWIMALAIGLANIYTLGVQGSINPDTVAYTFVDRLCIGTYSFIVYLYKLVWPHPMSPMYPYPSVLPTMVYVSPLLFAAFWAGIYWLWKRDRRMEVFGALFFFVNVVFMLQILGAGQGFLADRFTYVPYFGFFAVAGWYFDQYVRQPASSTPVTIAAGAVFLVFALVSVRQIGIWKNGDTLWSHVISIEGETNGMAFGNRAQYRRDHGKPLEAAADYTKAIEINARSASKLGRTERDVNAETYNGRGKMYFELAMSGKFDAAKTSEYLRMALTDYTAALESSTTKPNARAEHLNNRGAAYAAMQRWNEAKVDFDEAEKLSPTNKNIYLNRSILYFQTQQFAKAIEDYTRYLKIDPLYANIWYERGLAHRILNQNPEAIADFNQAIKLDPNFGLAYRERARANMQAGNPAAAAPDYQRALQMGLKMEPFDEQLKK